MSVTQTASSNVSFGFGTTNPVSRGVVTSNSNFDPVFSVSPNSGTINSRTNFQPTYPAPSSAPVTGAGYNNRFGSNSGTLYNPAIHGPPQNPVQQMIYQQAVAKAATRNGFIPESQFPRGHNINYSYNNRFSHESDASNFSVSSGGVWQSGQISIKADPGQSYNAPYSGALIGNEIFSPNQPYTPQYQTNVGLNPCSSPPLTGAVSPNQLPTYNASRNCLIMAPDSTAGSLGATGSIVSSDGDETNSLSKSANTDANSSIKKGSKSKRSASSVGERKAAPTIATGRRNLKSESVEPDEAERRMKRRERNRRSAQKCRERKVQRTQELQCQVDALRVETSNLMRELDTWRTHAKNCIELLRENCPNLQLPQLYFSCLSEDDQLTRQINNASIDESVAMTQTSSTVDEHSRHAMSIDASENSVNSPSIGSHEQINYLPSMSSLGNGFRLASEDISSSQSMQNFSRNTIGRLSQVSPSMSNSTMSMLTPNVGQHQNLSSSSSNSTGLCNIITDTSPNLNARSGQQNICNGSSSMTDGSNGGSSSSSSPTNYELAFTGMNMDVKL